MGGGNLSPKAKDRKAKINKWDLTELQSFCTAKETIDRTRRQPTEYNRVFTNDKINKGLTSSIYKQLIQLNINITNNFI